MNGRAERLAKAVGYMVSNNVVSGVGDLASKTGWPEKEVEDMLNGRIVVSEQFVIDACTMCRNLNHMWILMDIGRMTPNMFESAHFV